MSVEIAHFVAFTNEEKLNSPEKTMNSNSMSAQNALERRHGAEKRE
jgi:hypothetical protein